MANECVLTVERAERSGRNVVSYTLSDGQVWSADEMKDKLLEYEAEGKEIGNVRIQRSKGKVWVRLRPTVPVTNSTLITTARNRAARKREVLQEQLMQGLTEELDELKANA